MIKFEAIIKRFGQNGDKTGWTYVEIPHQVAEQIKPNFKKVFRVKGKIDNHILKAKAITPFGEGNYVMAVNEVMRKAIGKAIGAEVILELEEDDIVKPYNEQLLECLKFEPIAFCFFNGLPHSHKNWYSNWVEGAKTETTITKRISVIVNACAQHMSFGEMMKAYKLKDNFTL